MLGLLSVGKTSLTERYVNSIFSDRYLSTVGLKISKKNVVVDGTEMSIVLWDMEGRDEYTDINMANLRGAMGFFVVADLTRLETFEAALKIRQIVLDTLGRDVPNILLLNKSDLTDWEVDNERVEQAVASGIKIMRVSAKTGTAVDEAFDTLARNMLEKK